MGRKKLIETPQKMWELFEAYRDKVKSDPRTVSEFHGREKNKEVAQAIMNQVMETIRKMHTEIQTMKAPKKAPSPTLFRKAKKSLRGLLKPLQ